MAYLKKIFLACACLAVLGGGEMWGMDWNKKLFEYCETLNVAGVKEAYKKGAYFRDNSPYISKDLKNKTLEHARTPLQIVIEKGTPDKEQDVIAVIKELLIPRKLPYLPMLGESAPSGPDLNVRYQEKTCPTLLMKAIEKGYSTKVLELLLDEDVDEDVKEKHKQLSAIDNNWQTVFHYAARHDKKEVLQWLFEQTIDKTLMGKGAAGLTPLHCAVLAGNIEGIEFILNNIDQIDQKNYNNFNYSTQSEQTKKIINLFLKHDKLNDQQKKSFIEDVFRAAIKKKDLDIIDHIVSNTPKELGENFLFIATHCGSIDAVNKLQGKPFFNVSRTDNQGKTALHYAAENGNLKIVKLLCKDKSINLDVRDNQGKTALHYAIEKQRQYFEEGFWYDDKSIIDFLMGKGANPRTWDNNGVAPCDRMPELIKDERLGSWLVNSVPEVLNNLLTGITTATLGYCINRPTTTKLWVLSLLTAGLVGSHIAEKKVQKNYTDYGYCKRNFDKKCWLVLAGAAGAWAHQKFMEKKIESI